MTFALKKEPVDPGTKISEVTEKKLSYSSIMVMVFADA